RDGAAEATRVDRHEALRDGVQIVYVVGRVDDAQQRSSGDSVLPDRVYRVGVGQWLRHPEVVGVLAGDLPEVPHPVVDRSAFVTVEGLAVNTELPRRPPLLPTAIVPAGAARLRAVVSHRRAHRGAVGS